MSCYIRTVTENLVFAAVTSMKYDPPTFAMSTCRHRTNVSTFCVIESVVGHVTFTRVLYSSMISRYLPSVCFHLLLCWFYSNTSEGNITFTEDT